MPKKGFRWPNGAAKNFGDQPLMTLPKVPSLSQGLDTKSYKERLRNGAGRGSLNDRQIKTWGTEWRDTKGFKSFSPRCEHTLHIFVHPHSQVSSPNVHTCACIPTWTHTASALTSFLLGDTYSHDLAFWSW
jgi:hypothetical protein